jgi:putative ATPase
MAASSPRGDTSAVPLAARMRPRTFDEFVGQNHVAGPERVLRRSTEADSIPSLILWGPPGSGKTTLAEIIAATSSSRFVPLTATSAGVADLRREVESAAKLQAFNGQRTILFIDEIHRFNKGQQDAVLPHVENGIITLIGATTENPSFEVNAALLSRCRVFRLEKLGPDHIMEILRRALSDEERGLGYLSIQIADDALERLVALSDGDARIALTGLELAVSAAENTDAGSRVVTSADIEDALQQPALLYDKSGDMHFHVISAFIKSVRGSDPDAAVYWLARMLEAGEDPLFVVRRMIILAAEDIGLADPQALELAVACQQAVHFIGMPEGYLPMTQCALYLATAPKSNSALTAYKNAQDDVLQNLTQPVPLHLRNATTGLNRALGFGAGYQYAHDYDSHYVDQQYLPDGLHGRRYYHPTEEGAEAAIRGRLTQLRREVP